MSFKSGPNAPHYREIESRMDAKVNDVYGGDIVAYCRAKFDHEGSLSGRSGLWRVVIERLCDEINLLRDRWRE